MSFWKKAVNKYFDPEKTLAFGLRKLARVAEKNDMQVLAGKLLAIAVDIENGDI